MKRNGTRMHGLAGLIVALIMLAAALPLRAQSAFYDATATETEGPPGSIIRSERMPNAPSGGEAYRVLYRSSDPQGRAITVSGVVIVPTAAASAPSGRPIIAWGHPTTGIVPRCAPSLAHFVFQHISGLRQFLDHGYIVAATDYPGLGTAGPHPFLVGVSEGRAVLDMVRAAKKLAGPDAGSKVALWGHSQGGQAVLFAAQMAKTYAPDLAIDGVGAAAPATDLATLLKDDLGTRGGDNLLAMTLWSWSRVYDAPLTGIVEPAAVPVVDDLARICLESPIDILPRRRLGTELTQRFLLDQNFIDREPWRPLIAENSVTTLPPTVPVFLAQGGADDTVRPQITLDYAKRLCAAGSRVTYLALSGVGHGFVAHDAAAHFTAWLEDRFSGAAPPSDCAALQ
jgi:acetyl esterase/lipase